MYHGTAYKTSGGLQLSDLMMNKNGRIVSRKKSATAKKDKRLEKMKSSIVDVKKGNENFNIFSAFYVGNVRLIDNF